MIGYNIDGLFTTQQQRDWIVEYYRTHKPKLAVVLNNLQLCIAIAQASPNTKVIYRKTFNGENDNIWKTTTPERYFEIYNDLFSIVHLPEYRNLLLYAYTCNEPSVVDEYARWEVNVAKIALQRDLRLCVGNFSVGTPNYNEYVKLHELLFLLVKNPKKLLLGVHEYAATNWYEPNLNEYNPNNWNLTGMYDTHLLGRYKKINEYCRKNFSNVVQIAITEFGFDTIYSHMEYQSKVIGFRIPMGITNSIPQFSSVSTNWQHYVLTQLQCAWKALYRESNIVGQALFCYGGVGVWGEYYNFAKYPELLNILKGFRDNVVVQQEVIRGSVLQRAEYTGNVLLRFRREPNTNSSAMKTIITGEIGFVFSDSKAVFDGYTWKRFMFSVSGALEIGWCAISVDGANFTYKPIESGAVDLTDEIELAEELLLSLRNKQ